MKGNRKDLLYGLAKYALNHQWDIIKHNNTKTTAIMATTITILSIYLGLQITELQIFGLITNLSCLENIVATLLFIFTLIFFMCTIILFIFDLFIFRWGHIDQIRNLYD